MQVIGAVRQWRRLSSHGVIGEFAREEMSVTSDVRPDDYKNRLKTLFVDPCEATPVPTNATEAQLKDADRRNKFLQEMQRVKDEKKFTASTPESEQTLVAEPMLMRVMSEHAMWHRVNDAWVSGLLPKGGLIHVKSKNEYAFVLKAYECAALCWPAEQLTPNLRRKARDCTSLSWHVIFDLDDVEVLPTQYLSPVHLFSKDCLVKN